MLEREMNVTLDGIKIIKHCSVDAKEGVIGYKCLSVKVGGD
jgi:hypothetical protein